MEGYIRVPAGFRKPQEIATHEVRPLVSQLKASTLLIGGWLLSGKSKRYGVVRGTLLDGKHTY
eukprot:1091052-Pelagomonas_calceolata.AAC.2